MADAANRRGVSGTNATALTEQRFLPSPTLSSLVHGAAEPPSPPHKCAATIYAWREEGRRGGGGRCQHASGACARSRKSPHPFPPPTHATHITRSRRVRRQVQGRRRRPAEPAQTRFHAREQQCRRVHCLAPLRNARVFWPEGCRSIAAPANHQERAPARTPGVRCSAAALHGVHRSPLFLFFSFLFFFFFFFFPFSFFLFLFLAAASETYRIDVFGTWATASAVLTSTPSPAPWRNLFVGAGEL